VQKQLILCDVMVGLATAATLVLMGARERSWERRLAGSAALAGVGLFSYSLYLVHAPLLQILWQYAIAPLRMSAIAAFATLTIAGTPVILLASYGFYLVFERPFAIAKKRAPAPIVIDAPVVDAGGTVAVSAY
jgi:peptidoglycan/LPS O-acetylase OafA/YrhL